MSKPRTIVYVDGFNLYYGVLKHTKDKWLDLQKFFRLLRQDDDLVSIKYFTAPVQGGAKVRQRAYFDALSTTPMVEVILGRFKDSRLRCRCQACAVNKDGPHSFIKSEEKRTDVAIAIEMLDDAYQDNCDNMVLVSGDSDLVPPVSRIKQRFPEKKIIVYIPFRDTTRGAATELRNAADKDKQLPLQLIKRCQFPAKMANPATGVAIVKPSKW